MPKTMPAPKGDARALTVIVKRMSRNSVMAA
jgi:hypothetical protein